MLQSMTGFGRDVQEWTNRSLTVEVRALNNKFLDLTLRLPQALRSHEMALRSMLQARLQRGKVDLTVTLEIPGGEDRQVLNAEAIRQYHQALQALAPGLGEPADGLLPLVMGLPNVTVSAPAAEEAEIWERLEAGVSNACAQLEAFRQQEGVALRSDLLAQTAAIEGLQQEVAAASPGRLEKIRARMEQSLAETAASEQSDPNRLEQELVYWMDKLDLNEELVRLGHHLVYLRETLDAEDGEHGKKLGFIAQEIGREINTLGSKANDAAIQQMVVRMKDALEKIKEQALNVL